MKQLAVPFQQLVERRLWPLAVLLVAAAAAVPFLLAKDATTSVPSSSAPASDPQGATKPIVALADDATIESERRVLGAPKDPFRPAIAAKEGKEPDTVRATASAEGTDPDAPQPSGSPSQPSTGGGTTPSGTPTTPTDPTPAATPTPAPPKPTYPLYSLVARFGAVDEAKVRRLVLRSTGLPSNSTVGLVYKGLLKDRKTAVFWVVGGTEVEGDGMCSPGPENCQYVRIKVGETLFFTMPGGEQYQLDLLRVHAGRAEGKAARAQASSALPQRVRGGAGRYRYNWRTGVLDSVSRRELQASAAQASAAVPLG
jgi:hypothetical protein